MLEEPGTQRYCLGCGSLYLAGETYLCPLCTVLLDNYYKEIAKAKWGIGRTKRESIRKNNAKVIKRLQELEYWGY